jgi:hypothetical protein
MKLRLEGNSRGHVMRFRQGWPDTNGMAPMQRITQGGVNPCRHCLGLIARGGPRAELANRTYDAIRPNAETGPIFLQLESCERG